jgi:hypothetical protein
LIASSIRVEIAKLLSLKMLIEPWVRSRFFDSLFTFFERETVFSRLCVMQMKLYKRENRNVIYIISAFNIRTPTVGTEIGNEIFGRRVCCMSHVYIFLVAFSCIVECVWCT